MDQTIIENGNNVETYVYKNRIANSVETFEKQMSKKFATEGKIIGRGDYEFCKVDGKLVQVIPQHLQKSLKRVIKTLESEGLVSRESEFKHTSAVESILVAEESTM